MSEFDPTQERIHRIESVLARATEIVAGPGANPLEVFPDPAEKERRADVIWGAELSQEQQEAFRGVMSDLGPGRLYSVGPDSLDLKDDEYVAVFEGGLPHKMIAQLDIVDNAVIRPSEFVFSASPDRKLPQKEKESGAKLLCINLEETPENELDMAIAVVRARPGFENTETPPQDGTELKVEIGSLGGRPVFALPVRRDYHEDGSYTQMSNMDKMIAVANRGLPVVFVTSATYQPSCELAAIQASREGATTFVASYGAEELARVKGEALTVPTIAQLGAEAYKVTAELHKLKKEE